MVQAEGSTLQHLKAKALTLVSVNIHRHDCEGKLSCILHPEALSDGEKRLVGAQTCERPRRKVLLFVLSSSCWEGERAPSTAPSSSNIHPTVAAFHQGGLRDVEAQRASGAGQLSSNSQQLFGSVAPHRHHVKHRQVVPLTGSEREENTIVHRTPHPA